jgi:predicted metal-dependent peptidase
MNETKPDFDLNMHTARLLMSEPFFASLSRRVSKAPSTAIPTAGVRVNPETARFEMLYNPEFFERLTDAERTAVLIHEFYHLIFQHVTDRKPWTGQDVKPKEARQWNIACDLAINSHIKNLPEMACMPGVGPFVDFEVGLSAEAYLNLLKKKAEEKEKEQGGKESGEGGEGEGSGQGSEESQAMPEDSFDSHDGWGEGDSTSTEIAKERVKEYLKEAAKDAQNSGSGWGSVSQAMQREIIDRLSTKVDWKKVLRYFVKTSRRASKRSTVKRLNKRYAYIHAGKKVTRRANIAISIDQSGSVSDGMLAAFFSELNKLAKLAEFTVIPFDDKVFEEKIYVWKQGENKKWERVLCGGTNFDAPTEYVNKNGFDGHIVLTDMLAPKPKASKCQRMWMTSTYYASRPYFKTNERILAIDAE